MPARAKGLLKSLIFFISKFARRIFEFLKSLYNFLKPPKSDVSHFVKKSDMLTFQDVQTIDDLELMVSNNENFLLGTISINAYRQNNKVDLHFSHYIHQKGYNRSIAFILDKEKGESIDNYKTDFEISLPRKTGNDDWRMFLTYNVQDSTRSSSYTKIIVGSFIVHVKADVKKDPASVFRALSEGDLLAPGSAEEFVLNTSQENEKY